MERKGKKTTRIRLQVDEMKSLRPKVLRMLALLKADISRWYSVVRIKFDQPHSLAFSPNRSICGTDVRLMTQKRGSSEAETIKNRSSHPDQPNPKPLGFQKHARTMWAARIEQIPANNKLDVLSHPRLDPEFRTIVSTSLFVPVIWS